MSSDSMHKRSKSKKPAKGATVTKVTYQQLLNKEDMKRGQTPKFK